MRAALLAVAIIVAAVPQTAAGSGSYATAHGCRFEHRSSEAYRATTRLLRHERPVGPATKRLVKRWATCVATRAKAHALHEYVRRLWAWRHSYAHIWPIRFNGLAAGWRSWASATAWCESGGTMDPRIHSPSGVYHGLMQFDLRTWWEAGGTGDPHDASGSEQMVRGVWLARRVGTGRWPVCGR